MHKFYRAKGFKELQREWSDKLKASGFTDIENDDGYLKKDGDQRTIGFQNRDVIQRFFIDLGHYLAHNDINEIHRTVLELYSIGTKVKGQGGIVDQTGLSDRGCRYIIERYKRIILKQP